MDVVTVEHSLHPEVLLQGTVEVAFPLASETKHFIEDLKSLFLNLNGVGLAAPQVGSSQNIFVYRITDEQNSLRKDASRVVPITVLINAYYEPTSDANIVYDWEACFSVLNHTGKVPRYSKIRYHAYTPEGKPIDAIAEGFEARVLQHEIDHLQGILITHRLDKDCMQGKPDDMLALRYQEFTPQQKQIAKKLLIDRQKNTPATDIISLDYINRALRILEND
ncbi:MAG: peptide deformylase [Candidatus Berkiella sp.]